MKDTVGGTEFDFVLQTDRSSTKLNGHPTHPTTGKWNENEEADPRHKGNQQK